MVKGKTSTKPIVRRGSKASSRLDDAIDFIKSGGSSVGYLRTAIDSLEDELMIIDRDYRIIEANDAVLSRNQKSRQEVIGKYCYNISHSLSERCRPPQHECPVKEVWETGKPARATHIHVYHINGEKQERYVDIIASPIMDARGNVTAAATLMRDVTEAKKLELKISEAQRHLSALNTIANEVSQSLNLDTVLGTALDKTLEIMKSNTGGILLLDEEKQKLSYRVHQGLSKEYVEKVCCRLGEGIAGRVAQSREAILLEDIQKEPRAAYPHLIAAEGLRAFACVPLRSKERVLGVLNITSHKTRKYSAEDIQLLESIAAQIAIAIENAKLHEKVWHQDEIRGELLREIFSIQEEERRRIARELHDETSQAIASLTANLEAVVVTLPPDAYKAKNKLKEIEERAIRILDEINRLIYELRPTLLDDLGLVAATRWLIDNNLVAAGIAASFTTSGRERRLPLKLEATLFRVIQEAVNNIARHAHARKAGVNLHFKKKAIRVHVRDDGEGFDVDEAINSKERPRGLGLLGMKERVEIMNGTLSIRSRDGGGTVIDIEIPVNSEVSNG